MLTVTCLGFLFPGQGALCFIPTLRKSFKQGGGHVVARHLQVADSPAIKIHLDTLVKSRFAHSLPSFSLNRQSLKMRTKNSYLFSQDSKAPTYDPSSCKLAKI